MRLHPIVILKSSVLLPPPFLIHKYLYVVSLLLAREESLEFVSLQCVVHIVIIILSGSILRTYSAAQKTISYRQIGWYISTEISEMEIPLLFC